MPPVIVHTQTEQRAMALALDRARRDDLIFVLADDPAVIHQEILVERTDPSQHAPDIMTTAAL